MPGMKIFTKKWVSVFAFFIFLYPANSWSAPREVTFFPESAQVLEVTKVKLQTEGKDIKRIAVIGPDADAPVDQLGDYFPHNIPQEVVTVLKGLKNKVSSATKITYVKGCDVIGNWSGLW